MAHRIRRICSAAFSLWLISAASAWAQDSAQSISKINAWYAALSPENNVQMMQQRIQKLLLSDAMIVLSDLDITQNRQEFIDSLEGWASAIENGFIAHKIQESATATEISVIVCYNFGSNEQMTKEVFSLDNDMIVKSLQTTIAESCNGF